jgi:integrase
MSRAHFYAPPQWTVVNPNESRDNSALASYAKYGKNYARNISELPQSRVPTRFEQSQKDLTEEYLQKEEEFMEKLSPWSVETEKKHYWVSRLYLNFVAGRNKEAYPLDARLLALFINKLGDNYTVDTIRCVVIPSLKRIAKCLEGQLLNECDCKIINKEINKLQSSETSIRIGRASGPLMYADLQRMIEICPPGYPDKPMLSSLFLFALTVGARAITCAGIRLCDIQAYLVLDAKDGCEAAGVVQILERITKGDKQFAHVVSLEGRLNDKGSMNFVYWLTEHLMVNFGLSLSDFKDWNLTDDQKRLPLWDLSADMMRYHVKNFATRAGYPIDKRGFDLFCFHSFRAGFICSAALCNNVADNASNSQGFMEVTSMVARWDQNARSQQRYIRQAFMKCIVATRLFDSEHRKPWIEVQLTSPELFHGIVFNEVSWDIHTSYEAFLATYAKSLVRSLGTVQLEEWQLDCLKWRAFRDYVKSYPDKQWERLALKDINAGKTTRNTYMDIGRQMISDILRTDFSKVHEVVSAVVGYAVLYKDASFSHFKQDREKLPVPVSNLNPKTGHKIRERWTREQTATLIQ